MKSRSSLPVAVSFSEGGLLWGNQLVCNFDIRIEGLVESHSDDEVNTIVRYKCIFKDDNESGVKSALLSGLEAINWHNVDMRCRLNPDCNKANKYLAAIMRVDLEFLTPTAEYEITDLGTHFVNGQPLFFVGDRVILSPGIDNDVSIKWDIHPNRLAIDEYCSEHQAVQGMMEVVNLTPAAGTVIFAHCLLNIMRAVYTEVDKAPRCILFLAGKTGTKKTTFAAFQTQLYDRDKGIEAPMRLNASIPAAEATLNGIKDCVKILDDLFPSIGETKRNQERTFTELVRVIGDNSGRAIMKGNDVVTIPIMWII
jgi:hypothetical protein